jgi:cell division septation protein DedD
MRPQIKPNFPSSANISENKRSTVNSDQANAWGIRLTLSQVIVMWMVVAGTMVAAFLFGLYAGREQGLKQYLTENAREAVRLPILGEKPSIDQIASDYAAIANGASAIATKSPTNSTAASDAAQMQASKEDREVDFAATSRLQDEKAVVATAEGAKQGAGFATISASDALKSIDVKATKSAEKTTTTNSTSVTTASGWDVQVAILADLAEATKLKDTLTAKNLPARLEDTVIRKSKYYRVLVGPFAAEQEAQSKETEIEALKLVKGRVFLRKSAK